LKGGIGLGILSDRRRQKHTNVVVLKGRLQQKRLMGWGTLQEKRRKAKRPMTKMNIGIGGKGEIVRIILMSIEGE